MTAPSLDNLRLAIWQIGKRQRHAREQQALRRRRQWQRAALILAGAIGVAIVTAVVLLAVIR